MSEFGLRMMQASDTFEEFNNIQGETHTGNRNHTIKVPTKPSEPCRG